MDERKELLLELMLKLDLKVNEYKLIIKKYEEEKETMDEKELEKIETSLRKILKEIENINEKLDGMMPKQEDENDE